MTAGRAAPRRTLSRRLLDWAAGLEDGQILRAAFFGMLAATVAVLAIDYLELSVRDAGAAAATPDDLPLLPGAAPGDAGQSGPEVTTDTALLRQKLSIELGANGVLALVGTIDPGAAGRLAAEVNRHGEYVKTVALDSPGGSLDDALAMGSLIRDEGFSTSVADGALCASSCPLVFAGGKKRIAGPQAAIGVHEVYLTVPRGEIASLSRPGGPAIGAVIERTQQSTARIERYLAGMGVDPALWLHALDTPPQKLYYFSPVELAALKLVTNVNN